MKKSALWDCVRKLQSAVGVRLEEHTTKLRDLIGNENPYRQYPITWVSGRKSETVLRYRRGSNILSTSAKWQLRYGAEQSVTRSTNHFSTTE